MNSKAAKREEEQKQRAQEKQRGEKEKERKRADKERAALQAQIEEFNSLVDELKEDLKSERETVRFVFGHSCRIRLFDDFHYSFGM